VIRCVQLGLRDLLDPTKLGGGPCAFPLAATRNGPRTPALGTVTLSWNAKVMREGGGGGGMWVGVIESWSKRGSVCTWALHL
jgi:hypothetical protein